MKKVRGIYISVMLFMLMMHNTTALDCRIIKDKFYCIDLEQFPYVSDTIIKAVIIKKSDIPIIDLREKILKNNSIEKLSLIDDNIVSLENSFGYVPKLKILNLSTNKLRNLNKSLFIKNVYLFSLDLSRNMFTEIPILQSSTLSVLDLSYCRLNTIQEEPFKSIPKLDTLYVTGNGGLKTIHLFTLLQNPVEHLFIEDITVDCNCELSNQIEYLNTHHKLIGEPTCNNNGIQHKLTDDYVLEKCKSTCPTDCNCGEFQIECTRYTVEKISLNEAVNTSILTINIINQNFSKLNDPLFYSLVNQIKNVILESNNISEVSNATFSKLRYLEELSLHRNNLSFLPEDLFIFNEKIITLNISRNLFTEVPALSSHSIQNIDISHNNICALSISAFEFLTNLVRVVLDANQIAIVDFRLDLRPHTKLYLNSQSTSTCKSLFNKSVGQHKNISSISLLKNKFEEAKTTESVKTYSYSSTEFSNHKIIINTRTDGSMENKLDQTCNDEKIHHVLFYFGSFFIVLQFAVIVLLSYVIYKNNRKNYNLYDYSQEHQYEEVIYSSK